MIHNYRAERILVTGASGFIGMHLLEALHKAGADITAVVTADRDHARFRALTIPIHQVVVDDVTKFGEAVRDLMPRYIIHLNAYITLERSLKSVAECIQANLISTISLLTACCEVNAERIILMGSCEEYGQKYCPFDPSLALDPNSPYGASKAAATAYARMFYTSFQLPTVVLRPSVVYGPNQSPRQLISMVLAALAENRPIDVTVGRQTRDFVYIDDVVDAILLSLTAPNIAGDAWNIGSGEVITVYECLQRIERLTGRPGLIQYGARPYANSERFHYEPMVEGTFKALNWRPSVMLDEGLKRTWESIMGKEVLSSGKHA
jgi:nucleoside-diphosphate-sugar epimerase